MDLRQGCLRLLVFTWSCVIISGCAPFTTPPLIESTSVSPWLHSQKNQWHDIRFKIAWSKDDPPRWHLDALIAHQIIAPILQVHQASIPLWRFHRRASKDATGHQFSFIFYTDSQHAKWIKEQLVTNPVLAQLIASKWADIAETADSTEPRHSIAATSDRSWPPIIQQAWPHYIMGVSAFWLDLIHRQTQHSPLTEAKDLSDLADYYKQQHDQITLLWQEQGQHALLHHLNALFAYQPLHIIEHRMLRY